MFNELCKSSHNPDLLKPCYFPALSLRVPAFSNYTKATHNKCAQWCTRNVQSTVTLEHDTVTWSSLIYSLVRNYPQGVGRYVSECYHSYHRRTFPSHRGESTISQKWCAPRRGRRVIDIGGKISVLSSGGSRISPRWGRQSSRGRQHTTLPKFP